MVVLVSSSAFSSIRQESRNWRPAAIQ